MEIAMEGPLSKWTNVMNGWQYRWFVLDDNVGLLSYYTSKEKRMRGERRGCVRLQGAVIGIDDEDDSTFTITVDRKTFHFQARDSEEKERWINVLENTIMKIAQPTVMPQTVSGQQVVDFDRKLAEADAYLTILIDQVQSFQKRIDDCDTEAERNCYNEIREKAEVMIESIKRSIVLLQFSKHKVLAVEETRPIRISNRLVEAEKPPTVALPPPLPSVGLAMPAANMTTSGSTGSICRSAECLAGEVESVDFKEPTVVNSSGHASLSTSMPNLTTPTDEFMDVLSSPNLTSASMISSTSLEKNSTAAVGVALGTEVASTHSVDKEEGVPDLSYSTSEDEDYFDAEEGIKDQNSLSADTIGTRVSPKVISPKNDYFDELYDEDDEDNLESMENHGSLITHLLSQLRIGMDLTKVVLPTFILEKRSLLEMYSDFFAHPDLFVQISEQKTPKDRLIQTVRWYLSAFHAGRKSGVAKKPYNPILGETFRCYYELPGIQTSAEEATNDGPVPWCSKNNLSFIAEQVSHHPPISAFYAESFNKHISLNGYIWTKSKFLGLSIGVHMIGQAVISVLNYEEEYILTFPNGYGRSILTVPWMELGGNISITCPKTGYSAQLEFHTKPFYGGKKDLITAELFGPNDKKSFCTVKGEWNGIMWARYAQGLTQNEVFVDTKNMPIVKKQVKPIDDQWKFESRRLWRDVTYNLKMRQIEKATEFKYRLEQQQREEAKQRKDDGTVYETRFFHEVGEHWVYDRPLVMRLSNKVASGDSSPQQSDS